MAHVCLESKRHIITREEVTCILVFIRNGANLAHIEIKENCIKKIMLRLVIVPSFDSAYAKNKIKINFVHRCRTTLVIRKILLKKEYYP